jgi:hypothetical protein
MNGNLPGHPDDDEGLDPELIQLFDAAKMQAAASAPIAGAGIRAPFAATDDAFVASVLSSMQRNRRLRLIRQIAGLAFILTAGAFLAPYVARQTLLAAGWFTNQLPVTGVALLSPLGCLCAALLAWGIARRARNY